MILLRKANENDEVEIVSIIKEFYEENSNYDTLHGANFFGGEFEFSSWLELCENYETGKGIPKEHVTSSQFLIIVNEEIVGFVNIRHDLNEHLRQVGGHIGYSVRPLKRRKGYATKALELGLRECLDLGISEVLITCDDDNVGSYKTIEKCGGVLIEITEDHVRRYIIKL